MRNEFFVVAGHSEVFPRRMLLCGCKEETIHHEYSWAVIRRCSTPEVVR